MKFALAAIFALIVAVQATPLPHHFLKYEDNNGNTVIEDLDQPTSGAYAVDINKLKFMLYTVKNKAEPQELKVGNALNLATSHFSKGRPTKIVIHGWQNTYKMEAVQSIKDAYLANKDLNVILCDYEPYNSPYLTAVSDNDEVGKAIGSLISFLVQHGTNPADLHILGHSLGAHIAGNAARSVKSTIRIPRITGLDPAGPMFNDNKEGKRLSASDADIVEAVHTSTEFGMTNLVGTHDYYVNGGSDQPSCAHGSMSGGCDHAASFRYWAQAIGVVDAFPILRCNSVADAQSVTNAPSVCGRTNNFMSEIGVTTTQPGIYYVPV